MSWTARRFVTRPGEVKPRPVWIREYWDRFIRDEEHFHRTVRYIDQNPVRAGLAKAAEDWPWCSAAKGRVEGE